MQQDKILGGTVHNMPADLRKALTAAPKALAAWNSLTPLARNEWICWNIFVKQQKTRTHHIERTVNELQEGKRRPCCWLGCPHRKDKSMSSSARWVLNKQSKSSS
ncbi:MAG: YdeI/OmpD-associated family protein [Patescibacteria group bacterium]